MSTSHTRTHGCFKAEVKRTPTFLYPTYFSSECMGSLLLLYRIHFWNDVQKWNMQKWIIDVHFLWWLQSRRSQWFCQPVHTLTICSSTLQLTTKSISVSLMSNKSRLKTFSLWCPSDLFQFYEASKTLSSCCKYQHFNFSSSYSLL